MDGISRYRVAISVGAEEQLVSHAAFLANVSIEAAERLTREFEKAAETLSENPFRCPWLRDEYIPSGVYRYLLFEKRYMMIFKVTGLDVFVDYVIDCRQDYRWLIK